MFSHFHSFWISLALPHDNGDVLQEPKLESNSVHRWGTEMTFSSDERADEKLILRPVYVNADGWDTDQQWNKLYRNPYIWKASALLHFPHHLYPV